MMETVLTYTIDAVMLTGTTYLGVGFILSLLDLWHRSASPAQPTLARQRSVPALTAATTAQLEELPLQTQERVLDVVAREVD
ncbi:MAG: hypothetical protein F6J99_43455 [Moorea sp. SIO4G3]|nr:hypothetical protein [Moorena sp. SIO4G3]